MKFPKTYYPILLLCLLATLIQTCEEPSSQADTSNAGPYLSEIKTIFPAHTVFRENLLQEQSVIGLDSIRFHALQLKLIDDYNPSLTYSILGKVEENFSKHPCILLLKDAPQRSQVWLVVYQNGRKISDYKLVMDLEHPRNLILSGYLRKGLLEINRTGEAQSLFFVNSSGMFETSEEE